MESQFEVGKLYKLLYDIYPDEYGVYANYTEKGLQGNVLKLLLRNDIFMVVDIKPFTEEYLQDSLAVKILHQNVCGWIYYQIRFYEEDFEELTSTSKETS